MKSLQINPVFCVSCPVAQKFLAKAVSLHSGKLLSWSKEDKSAERLSLEVCKLEKAWNKFIRSQSRCDMKEKPLEFHWLGLVLGGSIVYL